MHFKPQFIEKYTALTDFTAYQKALQQPLRRSFRVNTLMTTVPEVLLQLEHQGFPLEHIPWCKEGFSVGKGLVPLGNTKEHREGKIYIQSAASLIPSIILDPQPGELVLDCCAAPGGKTTHLAALMENTGIIVANESDSKRIGILNAHLQRLHVMNVVVTKMSAETLTGAYDKILLDAPCSASGTIIGDTKESRRTLLAWNPDTILRLAKLQKKLLTHAYSLLKPEGTLVYSTCSLEPEEDENVIQSFLAHEPSATLEKFDLPLQYDWNYGMKIWPQYNTTEGFFIAKIRKQPLL
ncbi:MAG: RsmB/NOP family class I SAM-dependent RNA methyltransferase [Nanoarchaeota archaeon]